MKKAIVAGLIVMGLALTGCTDITKAYKAIGSAWTEIYFPGGDTNWLNNGSLAADKTATAGTKVTTNAGYVSTWTYTYKNNLTADNRAFKYNTKAEWGGDRGWTAIDSAKSTGVEPSNPADLGGSNIKIKSDFANGTKVVITLNQGAFDEATLSENKDVITVAAAP